MGQKTRDEMYMNRRRAAEVGQETIQILHQQAYTTPGGERVSLRQPLQNAIAGTTSYPPNSRLPSYDRASHSTRFRVANETTLAAARQLADADYRVALLNFASAKNPGGGFRTGARAQEESITRSSGLFACINGNPMYSHHRQRRDPFYTSYAIYSPDVPVFRNDKGELLNEPYYCGVITSPAVNAGALTKRMGRCSSEIVKAMAERIDKVLAVAAHHGNDSIVLGAWGCGVFRNQPADVAELFADALYGPYKGQFAAVTFAVLDYSKDQHIIGPFKHLFPSTNAQEC